MLEPAPKIKPWLLPFGVATAGVYVLLVALALGELPGATWALWLVPAAVALFGAVALVRRGP